MQSKCMKYFIFSFGLICIFCACEKPNTDNTPTNQTASVIRDTAYGLSSLQKMDIYLPANRSTAKTKLIVMIHGGGWYNGDKKDMEQILGLFRTKWQDVAIANINYRLTADNNIHYQEIFSDVTSAVNFIVNNKTAFQISDSLYILGASAGGHIATQYAYKYNTNNLVHAVVDFFGPANLADWSWYNSFNAFLTSQPKELLTRLNNSAWNEPLYKSNSPFYTATSTSKPTIIFHGTIDVIVPLYQSQNFNGQLSVLNVPHEYYEYLDGHGFNEANYNDAVNKAVAFLKKY